MKKKIVILVILAIVIVIIFEGIIKKYDGTVYSGSIASPSEVIKSYEELKTMAYFGNDENYAKNIDEKIKINRFIDEVEYREPDKYSMEYENIQKYKDLSNTLYDFIHNLYINTTMDIGDWDEYEYVRELLDKYVDKNMKELLKKYNTEFFKKKSLAFAYYTFSTGGDLEYKGAHKIGNMIIIKYNWSTEGFITQAFTHWTIVVEADKNVNKVIQKDYFYLGN